jgi:hypothetical protein
MKTESGADRGMLPGHPPPRMPLGNILMAAMILLVTMLGGSGTSYSLGMRVDTVRFDGIRVEYTTTSDWSLLEWRDTSDVLTMRTISVTGTPTTVKADMQQVVLGQGLADAKAGNRVGITIDYAIRPASKQRSLEFLLKKGALNESSLRAWRVTPNQELHPLLEFDHKGIVPDNPGENPMMVRIDLTPLQPKDVQQKVMKRPELPRIAWAFYYPWYRPESWRDPRMTDSPGVLYSSDDPKIMSRHIQQAKRVGIDGFVCSWWGPGDYTDSNFNKILDIARDSSFFIALYFETLNATGPRDDREIEQWLRYAIQTYRNRPAFMKLNGRPLIVLWASNALPLARWKVIIDRLNAEGLEAAYLGMGDDMSDLQVFDGLHQYGVVSIPSLSRHNRLSTRGTKYYSVLADSLRWKISTATVQPGYDERSIPGRRGLSQARGKGAFYSSTFQAAIDSDPDWIFIVSWNEWYEHTQIESGRRYGDTYFTLTQRYLKKWKSRARS